MASLRSRFILSHILPLLLVIPLVGLVLIYVLETQVFVAALTEEVQGQAELIAALARDEADLWRSSDAAERFVSRIQSPSIREVLLVGADGTLLAGNSTTALGSDAELTAALQGNPQVSTSYGATRETSYLTVWQPVVDANGTVLGAVRVTHELNTLTDDLSRLRFWIVGTLLGALVVGAGVGSLLAVNLEQPLQRLTDAVQAFARGGNAPPIPEEGVTEIRMVGVAFNGLVKRLRELEAARKQLLANLVHEIGRPLGALYTAVQALRGGAFQQPAFRDDLLSGMEGEVTRLHRLLDNLAELHEQVLGTLELQKEPLFLSQWLPSVLIPWHTAATAKGITWETAIPADLPSFAADPDRLAQVVGNLVSNAIKFTRNGGKVQVSAGQQEGEVWIEVEDSGEGIAVGELTKIFEPFYRSNAHHRFPQGMGLGLTIAHDIVKAHGGRIEVKSVEGEGTAFRVWLPL